MNISYAEELKAFTDAFIFEVFQVFRDEALAKCENSNYGVVTYNRPLVYLPSNGQTQ